MEIKDAVALVTGGSEGIGRGIAEALKAEGARVTITGRREDVLRAAAKAMGADFIAGDVGVEADAVRTVAAVIERTADGFPGILRLLAPQRGHAHPVPRQGETRVELYRAPERLHGRRPKSPSRCPSSGT